ncbi:hypothetical protein BB561_003417 [Smittium simulii]|uniref:Man1/Src1-like C-terminal domain-containing protein n=1 Tax=Smittium simulii TaxID=133385 RepID=A0A2T9YLG4_9FUNG|nr:hypothetical protein BB561_003417 [Smittium simulii]
MNTNNINDNHKKSEDTAAQNISQEPILKPQSLKKRVTRSTPKKASTKPKIKNEETPEILEPLQENQLIKSKKRKNRESLLKSPLVGTPTLENLENFGTYNPFQSASRSNTKKLKKDSETKNRKSINNTPSLSNKVKADVTLSEVSIDHHNSDSLNDSKVITDSNTAISAENISIDVNHQNIQLCGDTSLALSKNIEKFKKLQDSNNLEQSSKILEPMPLSFNDRSILYDNPVNPIIQSVGNIHNINSSIAENKSLISEIDNPLNSDINFVKINRRRNSLLKDTPKKWNSHKKTIDSENIMDSPLSWNLSAKKSLSVSELIEYYESTGNAEALRRLYLEHEIIQANSPSSNIRKYNPAYSSAKRNTIHDYKPDYNPYFVENNANMNLYSKFQKVKSQSPKLFDKNTRESDLDTKMYYNNSNDFKNCTDMQDHPLDSTHTFTETSYLSFLQNIYKSKYFKAFFILLMISMVTKIWSQNLLFRKGFIQKRKDQNIEHIKPMIYYDKNDNIIEKGINYLNYQFDKNFIKQKGLKCIDNATCKVGATLPYKCFQKLSRYSNSQQICISNFNDNEQVIIQCDPGYVIVNNKYSSVLYPLLPTCVADMETIIKVHSMIETIIKILKCHRGKVECSQSLYMQIDRIIKTENIKSSNTYTDFNKENLQSEKGLKKYVESEKEINDLKQAEIAKTQGVNYNEIKKMLKLKYNMTNEKFEHFFELALNKLVKDYTQQLTILRLEYIDSDVENTVSNSNQIDQQDSDYINELEGSSVDDIGGVYLMANSSKYSFFCKIKIMILTSIIRYFKNIMLITIIIIIYNGIRNRIQRFYEEKGEVERLVNLTISKLETVAYSSKVKLDNTVEPQIPSTQLRDSLFFSNPGATELGEQNYSKLNVINGIFKGIKLRLGFSKANYYDHKTRQRIWQKVVQIVEKNTNVRTKSTIIRGQPMRTWEWVGPFFNAHKTESKIADDKKSEENMLLESTSKKKGDLELTDNNMFYEGSDNNEKNIQDTNTP